VNKKGIILIIAGIVLVLIVSYFMYKILNPYDFSEEIKSLCNQVGGEWEAELGLCINVDKETCESSKIFGGYGYFLTFEELENFGIDLDSACLWEEPPRALQ